MMEDAHKFLETDPVRPDQVKVRAVAVALMNEYLGQQIPLSRSKLLKIGPRRIKCWCAGKNGNNRREWESLPVSVTAIEHTLATNREFLSAEFNLYEPECQWLDSSVSVSPGFHSAMRFAIPTNLGERFPLTLTIDREGTAVNSPIPGIQTRISDLRTKLIKNSDAFAQDFWFQDLRTIITESVTLIDVMLHQLYYKAEYNPLPSWNFDEKLLGKRDGMRMNDKFSWVHLITGNHINADIEMIAFKRIRTIRNHLQHFDPPCFCFTMEDAAGWLNDVQSVMKLAWSIRQACGSPLSSALIRNLIAPTVRFSPKNPNQPRLPQPPDVGYAGCIWKSGEKK